MRLRTLGRGLGYALTAITVCASANFVLAQIALIDLEQPPGVAVPGSLAGAASVAGAKAGRIEVRQAELSLLLSGHVAPVATTRVVGNGKTVLSAAIDGSVRLTDADVSARLQGAAAPTVSAAIYDRLWAPFGLQIAQNALWLAAQVLPLRVPETLEGSRGRVFRDCGECPEMVEIVGPGWFLMGSPMFEVGRNSDEGPRQPVSIGQSFAVGRFTVTFDEWDACVAGGGCGGYRPEDQGWGRGRRPVINVSWDDAKGYVDWLSKMTGHPYRLLTEAEWEYIARAGTTTRYSWGDEIVKGNANCSECGSDFDDKQTAPVGSFKPNAFGLFDIHGNVWQWVADSYFDTARSKKLSAYPETAEQTPTRVRRGGSWYVAPRDVRSAVRDGAPKEVRLDTLGLRVARAINRE